MIDQSDEVLECACGTGMLSSVIAERCRHLTATDYSRKMLIKAEKNLSAFHNVTYRSANITALE